MEASTQVPAVSKRLYRNNTGGWIGVVQLDHLGQEKGVNIEPFGTIWLSDAEVILTARAPSRPADNPFEEQIFWQQDAETGGKTEVRIRPVTLERADARYVPANDRYVPTEVDPMHGKTLAEAAAKASEPTNVSVGSAVADRTREVLATAAPPLAPEAPRTDSPPAAGPPSTGSADPSSTAPPPPTPAPPPAGPVKAMRTETADGPAQPTTGLTGTVASAAPQEERTSWVREAPAPGQVISGTLSGSDDVPSAPGDPTLPQPGDAAQGVPQGAPPQQPGAVAEEHAAVDPSVGEETGAARPPAQPQPEGEYAQAEEVGSPNAPTQVEPEDVDGLIGS